MSDSPTQNVDREGSHELESQFVLRLPEAPASTLRDALRIGNVNLKDRLKFRLDNDMRHGTVYLDDYILPGKLVDLPCIIESHKTIDKKVVYKTADICQMFVCTEEEEPPDEESKQKKKDDKKVDKKYIWPHGITPPLKNVRKRRFRKTLKKKQYLDQPEIEKEVRRLLRMDYEAHHVSWEVLDEEEDKNKEGGKDILMQGSKTNETPAGGSNTIKDLFGDTLSDSDADDEDGGIDRDDDESRITIEEGLDDDESSRLSDSISVSHTDDGDDKSYATSFSKEMFIQTTSKSKSPDKSKHGKSKTSDLKSMSEEDLTAQLNILRNELNGISMRRQVQEATLSTTNTALKSRLEMAINQLASSQRDKEREIRDVEMALNQLR